MVSSYKLDLLFGLSKILKPTKENLKFSNFELNLFQSNFIHSRT